jgi:hypothetical protein
MRVLGIFAAADVAAVEAYAKLRPRGADREAILAALARRRHRLNVVEVLAKLRHVRDLRSSKTRL